MRNILRSSGHRSGHVSPGPDAVIRVVSLWSSSGSSTSSEVPVLARPSSSSSCCWSDGSSNAAERARSVVRLGVTSRAAAGLHGLGRARAASPGSSAQYRASRADAPRVWLASSSLGPARAVVALRRTASGRSDRLQLDARRHTADSSASFATRCFGALRPPPSPRLPQKNAVRIRGGATWPGTRAQDDINYPSGSDWSAHICLVHVRVNSREALTRGQ